MATDDQNRGKDQDTDKGDGLFGFVDRDDDGGSGFNDGGSGFIDRDYDDSFPGMAEDNSEESPDPGYSAFSEELDDPLADWPSPDSVLDDLPEMREQEAVDPAGEVAAAEASAGLTPSHDDDLALNSGGSLEEAGETDKPLFLPADDDDYQDDGMAMDRFDTDQPNDRQSDTPPTVDDDYSPQTPINLSPDAPVTPAAKNDLTPPPEYETADSQAFAAKTAADDLSGLQTEPPFNQGSTDSDPAPVIDDVPPPPPPPSFDDSGFDIPDPPGAEYDTNQEDLENPEAELDDAHDLESPSEADFVDDFLNDLDDGDASDFQEETPSATPQTAPEFASTMHDASVSQAMETARVQDNTVLRAQAEEPSPPMNENPPSKSGLSSLPLGMIAVVALALVLLIAGGYGVVQQRTSLQGEIRELQAQLATAVSPDEAAAERERQRQVEVENEALASEMEALQAENSALGQQLAELEAQLAQQEADDATAAAQAKEAERQAAAAREAEHLAAQRQRQAAAQASAAKPAGPWFVNFGSYAQRDVADSWAKRLRVNDGQVVVQSASAAGKTLYRVRIVGLASQDAAERVAKALETEHSLPRLWVGRS